MKVAQSGMSLACALVSSLLTLATLAPAWAQTEGPQRPAPDQQQQNPAPSQPPPAPPAAPGQPNYSISVTVPVVNVDVVVTDNDGNYLSGLKKENFRITEDGATQAISNFATVDAPITVVLLVEYSQLGYYSFLANARYWGDIFIHQLKPVDWVALESFNMRSNVDVDFTHDPREVEQGLIQLVYPPFHESNLFDALADAIDRMRGVKGKKSILVLASGIDTFSRLTLDKVLPKVKETDVTINCVGVAEPLMVRSLSSGGLTYAQAQNQLKTFAELTGGRAWFPRFDGEIPDIMRDVAVSLRNEYSIGYMSTNQANDGKYRKIKIELVNPDGGPLVVLDQKGKKHAYHVYARQGYAAPTSSVSN
jgi:VWFA-related protein